MRPLVVAILFLVLSGRGASDAGAAASATKPFTVSVHGGAMVYLPGEQVSLKLADVRDERCPSDVRCIWAGRAWVTLEATANHVPAAFLIVPLWASATEPAPTYRSLRFTILSLTPTRPAAAPLALGSYEAVVRVEPI